MNLAKVALRLVWQYFSLRLLSHPHILFMNAFPLLYHMGSVFVLPFLISVLSSIFKHIDRDSDGVITMTELEFGLKTGEMISSLWMIGFVFLKCFSLGNHRSFLSHRNSLYANSEQRYDQWERDALHSTCTGNGWKHAAQLSVKKKDIYINTYLYLF